MLSVLMVLPVGSFGVGEVAVMVSNLLKTSSLRRPSRRRLDRGIPVAKRYGVEVDHGHSRTCN